MGLIVLDEGKRKVVTGVGTTLDGGYQLDPFQRLRVSNPNNIFEFKFNTDTSLDYYFSQRNTNGGTQSQLTDKVSRELSVTTTAGSTAAIQSRRYIEYTVGKGQQIHLTGNFKGAIAGVEKCFGSYDDDNGVFFKLDGTTPKVVVRSKTSGSVVDTEVAQSAWNGDRLDGSTGENNPSGLTVDFTKHNLFFIDYAWLGIGDIRFGIFLDGKFHIVHTFQSAGSLTVPYSQSGNLPIRAEIVQGTGVASTMEITCVSVATEGSRAEIGRVRNGNTETTAVSFTTTETFVFGIRLNSSNLYSAIEILNFNILARSGNDQAIYRIYYNPTLTGATWTGVTNTIVDAVSNSPTFSGGLLLDSGYITLNKQDSTSANLVAKTDIFAGRDIDGASDPIILTLQALSGTGSANFSGSWREFL